MMFLRLLPVLLSAILMAAHLSRHGAPLLALVALVLPAVLLVRRPWVPRVMQVALVLAALEWVRTGVALGRERLALGEPWARMAVILIAVATVTAASALIFRLRAVRTHFDAP